MWPNPTAGYIGEQIHGGSFGSGEQGFFIEQEFILGGKLGLNRKIFAQDVRQAEAENDEQRLRVTNWVKIQYYQALAAQEMVNMRKELLQISSETAKYGRQLFNIAHCCFRTSCGNFACKVLRMAAARSGYCALRSRSRSWASFKGRRAPF